MQNNNTAPLQLTWSMTPTKATTYVESLKYKKDHEIEAFVNTVFGFDNGFMMKIACTKPVTDIETGYAQKLRTQWSFKISNHSSYEELKAFFFFTILQQELHELTEWARTETGEHIYDPHPYDPNKLLLKKDISITSQFVKSALNYTGKLCPDGFEV